MRAALSLASVLVLSACNMSAEAQGGPSGGVQGQRSYDLAGFDAVSLAGPHDVIVAVGSAHSVRAEGDSETLDRLDLKVEDGALKIGMKKGNWSIGWSKDRPKTRIYVTLPAIRAAAIAGSGDMQVDRVQGDRFAASIAGSGDIKIQTLQVGEATFKIAGSGDIVATGTAQRAAVSIAGSGNVNLEAVEVRRADVSIVGSGDVRARAMETADVSIMGSGDVVLSGPARCNVNKRGSGNVRCGA